MRKTVFFLGVVLCLVLGFVATAYAFLESSGLDYGAGTNTSLWAANQCSDCHGRNDTGGRSAYIGPHGGYTSATDKCGSCHDVHEALSNNKLLPAPTIFGVCNTCHDMSFYETGGRGGNGVYGAIRARGLVAASRHNIEGYNNTDTAPSDGSKSYESTALIPGGNTSLPETLTCTACHTPHGNTALTAFKSERVRKNSSSGLDASQTTNKLLKDNLRGTDKGTYTVYGSPWCAACHDRRHQGAQDALGTLIRNHPTNNTAGFGDSTQSDWVDPSSIGPTSTAWIEYVSANATLPAHQAGWSREATKDDLGVPGWAPICQQCHYNKRDVEAPFYIISADGTSGVDNPLIQTFPHEGLGTNLLVETGDDLCLNCHTTITLP